MLQVSIIRCVCRTDLVHLLRPRDRTWKVGSDAGDVDSSSYAADASLVLSDTHLQIGRVSRQEVAPFVVTQ